MTKKRSSPSKPKTLKKNVTIANDQAFENGLEAAIFGGPGIGGGINAPGFYGQGSPFTAELSQPNTIFKNLRFWLVSNDRQFLSEMYVELGLVQTVVDVPVDDALRGGISIKSKQLSEDDIEELKISVDRDNDLGIAGDAAKWMRLYGGAGILILTDQDPMTPLDLDQIGPDTPLEFRAADMWELFWDKQNDEGFDPAIQADNFEFYSYYGEKVHKSRVMRLKGFTAPAFIRPRLRGWGVSIVEILVRSINQYLKSTDVLFEVLDETKVDVFKIKNLTNTLLGQNGEANVRKRIAIANGQKNYQHALVIDSEDDWEQKVLSFAGLSEVMQQIRMQVASDLRMPMLKLFGTPSQGLGSSDEDSIEVYNGMVESQVREKLKYDILRVLEIKCQKLFGFVPDDLTIEFKPLRVLSAEQEENVKTQKWTRILAAFTAGLISDVDAQEACNKGNLFDVKIDTSGALLTEGSDLEDDAEEGDQDPAKPKDSDDPGANRPDTRKARAYEVGKDDKPAPRKPDTPVRGKAEAPAKARNSRSRVLHHVIKKLKELT